MSDGDDGDGGPRGPERDGRLSPEGNLLLIFGLAAAALTALYAAGNGSDFPTVLLLGGIASVTSLGAVVVDLTRSDFRPSTGLYGIITLSAAAAAVLAYVYDGALLTAVGLGVVAIANAMRVIEVDFRDEDSLLDPLVEDDEDESGEEGSS
ncbi:hypothetical protein [Haloglomus litoreum]|uniref:hypothetical protein n=1 Tax=Haloglomus litoreum TaxID=3034026 RepID=UPI0023E7CFB0|nr:hypothetical protein [Haloglomus sp. DT116]